MKITEQGEMRSFHFANPDLAVRYLEQTLGAAIARSCEACDGAQGDDARRPAEPASCRRMRRRQRRGYSGLVDDPGPWFFTQATPFDADRGPQHREPPDQAQARDAPSLTRLRAIPWVFAWSQCRLVLTGWYGVGAALARGVEERGADALRALPRARSRFLATSSTTCR